MYVLQSVVDYDVSFGTTVNICALDLYKAFDKTNHHGLFIKLGLMDRNIPVKLLMLFEDWFSVGVTCVKWGSIVSRFIGLLSGIRQGHPWPPYGIGQAIIFLSCGFFFYLVSSSFFRRVFSAMADWMSTIL